MAKKRVKNLFFQALILSIVAVFAVDFLFHYFFSSPMETTYYFLAKFALFFAYSFLFLKYYKMNKKWEFYMVVLAGAIVSLIFGAYYNIFPAIFHYSPFGISLAGLTFLRMGEFGTGLAFGIVHTSAFVVGYYVNKRL